MDEISSCVLHYHNTTSSQKPHPQARLLCFATPHPSGAQSGREREGGPLSLTQPERERKREGEREREREGGLSSVMVLGKMRKFLPSHCIPDELVWVESIPMTTHGENNIIKRL